MWKIMLILLVLGSILCGIYSYWRIKRVLKFYHVPVEKRGWRIVCLVMAVVVWMFTVNMRSVVGVMMIHILVIFLLMDVAAAIFRLIRKKVSMKENGVYEFCRKTYHCGIVPIILTATIFLYGYYNMNHIRCTEYVVETTKAVGDYKIVLITDTHYGTIQDTDILKGKIDEINAHQPDIVLLGGDIVEEGTSKEEMQEVFALLGSIDSRYGVYYVYGNHDRQVYTNDRTYSMEELASTIEENGIQILYDNYVEINEDLILAGRNDASWDMGSERVPTEEILNGADREKYIIMADHQPVDVEENDAQGVDLELSGHTHGGQIWPLGVLTRLMGGLNYGEYQIGDCKVIVSSGFAGWGYPVKTGKYSEYAVIQVQSE